jgi:hypothetical protein
MPVVWAVIDVEEPADGPNRGVVDDLGYLEA